MMKPSTISQSSHGSSVCFRIAPSNGIPFIVRGNEFPSHNIRYKHNRSFTPISRILCSRHHFKFISNELSLSPASSPNKNDLLIGKYGHFDSWSRDILRRLRNGRAPRRKMLKNCHVYSSLSIFSPDLFISGLKKGVLSIIPSNHPLLSLPLSHPSFLILPALCCMAFSIWGLSPTLRFFRKFKFRKDDGSWEESKTKYMMSFYIRPIILWISMIVICHGLDPIILESPASHAIKERFLNFVRSLSTVLTFAFCTASLTQQIQKFVERSTSPEGTRNLGVQFVGNTVYTLVWIAAVILFMELLGFSTQKWITAGGFGTVLITLAGRELVTNFLSSIMIHATRPFMVNEWIQTKIDGYEVSGTVEHVGWWEPSIIRGDDREAIYIPNHKFTVTVLRNLSQKTHWRIKTYFAISHLDVNKISDIISTMRKVVAKHPQIEQRHLHRRIFLEEIKQDSNALMIMVSVFVKTSHFEEYLRVREMVILDLLKVISHYGARLATPLRSVQRVYDETETRGSGFREYGGNRANSRPFLLLNQVEIDQAQEMADLSPSFPDTVLEVSPSPPSPSPSPSRSSPLKEMNADASSSNKMRMEMEMERPSMEEKKTKPSSPSSSSSPPTPSLPSRQGKGGKEKNYESEDESELLDMVNGTGVEFRVAGVPLKTMSPPSELNLKSKSNTSSSSPDQNQKPSSLNSSPTSSSAATPSPSPSPPTSPSPLEVRASLEGLDSMGLNDGDITLLGAAFEKSHANVHHSSMDANTSFSKAADMGVVSIELEEVISSRSPSLNQKNTANEAEEEKKKKSEQGNKEEDVSNVLSSSPSPVDSPSFPNLSEVNSAKDVNGDMNRSSESDFWHDPLPSSSSQPSPSSYSPSQNQSSEHTLLNNGTVSSQSSSSQENVDGFRKGGEEEQDEEAKANEGKEKEDVQDKEIVSENIDSSLPSSSSPVTPPSNSSPVIQSVGENIVLDVAIHGLKKTLPLDDDPSSRGHHAASFAQEPSPSPAKENEKEGKEEERMSVMVASTSKPSPSPPNAASSQDSAMAEGQSKITSDFSAKEMER